MSDYDAEHTTLITSPTPVGPAPPGPPCVVVLEGPQVGRRIDLGPQPFVIGRRLGDLIVPDDRAMSRQHAALSFRGEELVVRDLGSTNRTYVNRRAIHETCPLRVGDVIQIGGLVLKVLADNDPEARCHAQMYARSTTDGLTGAMNRTGFDETLRVEVARAERYGTPLSLLLFDIDHFKRFNDTHGHQAGDAVLRHLARVVKARLRTGDTFARYGGEEFALLLLAAHDEARGYAEVMRARVADSDLVWGDPPVSLKVTISVGVATFGGDTITPASLIELADRRLYEAKRSGRNRVCSAPRAGAQK